MAPRPFGMKLFTSIGSSGSHAAGWRHPDSYNGPLSDFEYFKGLAQAVEAAKFHGIFFSDSLALGSPSEWGEQSKTDAGKLDPLTLIAALAVVTKRIGLAITLSTGYEEPFNVARRFASVDHLSNGRSAWNIVTSASGAAAANFGRTDLQAHDARYERAQEFVEAVTGLWDTWEDDAFARDKASGRYFDPAKVHPLDYKGRYFSVAGPAITPRPVQGYPVLIQAGASGAGRAFAARNAELLYMSIREKADAVAYCADVRGQAQAYGRDPAKIIFLAQMMPFVGATEEEARDKADRLAQFIPYPAKLALFQRTLGDVDLSTCDPDGPLPDDLPLPNTVQGYFLEITAFARREKASIRQLVDRYSSTRNVVPLVGSYQQVADTMEDWVKAGACDGFMLAMPYLPGGLGDFVEHVVPILRQRGLFRSEFEGQTLRENLGLDRPANRFA